MSPGRWSLAPLCRVASGFVFLLFLLVMWEMLARSGYLSPNLFPPISTNISMFVSLLIDGVLAVELLNSLWRVMSGLLLAIITMVPLGVLIGASRLCRETLGPLIEFLRPLPPTAVIPVAMLFLGIGDGMKISVILFSLTPSTGFAGFTQSSCIPRGASSYHDLSWFGRF